MKCLPDKEFLDPEYWHKKFSFWSSAETALRIVLNLPAYEDLICKVFQIYKSGNT